MTLQSSALRLTIFVGEFDKWHHKPLCTEIVHRAHKAGLAGATVLRGVEGYGGTNRVHTLRILSLSEDLPMVIIIVDAQDKIRAFLPQLDELVHESLIIVDPVEVIRSADRAYDRIGHVRNGGLVTVRETGALQDQAKEPARF